MTFDYEYFCGANVVLSIEGVPLTELAGLRLSIMESKRPIYGYSSRHFDAVASGQVLVEGSLCINYVDHNYLFKAIELGLQDGNQLKLTAPPPDLNLPDELHDQLENESQAAALLAQFSQDPANNQDISQAFKDRAWGPLSSVQAGPSIITPSPHDSYAGVDIDVTFGTREIYNFYGGLTSFRIQSIHFLGRALPIQISEDVIVEEYPFFARNIVSIKQPYTITVGDSGADTNSTQTSVTISQQ